MESDGLLLNFELPTDAFAFPKTTFKGGRWKDRLTARKSAEYGRNKARERAAQQDQVGNNAVEVEDSHPEAPITKKIRHDVSRLSKPSNREVISSLFTYNPSSSTTVKEDESSNPIDETPVEPSNAPLDDAIASFTSLGLSETLASHLLRRMQIKAPTAVQRKAVAQLCNSNTDAFIQAQTGSGKTLAYLLPMVQHIAALSKQAKDAGDTFTRQSGLFGIILAPTRELSKQISVVLEDLLLSFNWIVAGTVIGGEKKKSEKARLRKGLNILVATPGRLADHLNNTEVLDVSKVRWLVLDEGDRLMELGFQQDIQRIIGVLNLRSKKIADRPIPGLPEKRMSILCSATIKTDVDELRSISLKDPITITADPDEAHEGSTAVDQIFSAPSQLKQSYAVVPAKQRLVSLVAVLKQTFKRKGSVMKCIIFISCADSVDFHFDLMTRQDKKVAGETEASVQKPESDIPSRPTTNGKTSAKIPEGGTIAEAVTQAVGTAFSNIENKVDVFRLHGSLQQVTRTRTLKAFTQSADPAVLICTDVASRGLDVPNVDLVIEYDPPFSKDDHVHRVGRTARAGRDGRAMIFLQPGCEEGYAEVLQEGKPRHPTRHDAAELLKKGFAPSAGVVSTRQSWEERATNWQLEVERWALENAKHLEQARRAYQSHIRAYATHVAAERKFFDMQQLHLGHLAKAFGLRDKPGSIRVPGLRPTGDATKKTKEARKAEASRSGDSIGAKRKQGSGGLDTSANEAAAPPTDAQAARRKMHAKMRAMGGASEFNLG